ncbi:hypothetical protein HCC61_15375 [Streptomyces sp. HNM0575]|uniref:hypothetical protein n=1 Tax=Streptomyces sp. HNM0575 TaxID=2716338 RepID=UPI00145DC007|nr:hypothetical protein [Streptomyces sp. HNM0575]NLU74046.1 hypothetical protein [Streptomyces sp. HNM0575]
MPDRSSSRSPNGKQQQVQETVTYPMRTMRTAAERVPGAERVRGVFDDMLNTVGIVSPQARRVAAYTGAGILGVAGLVEWPVAVAGAAAVWLTQPRPADMDGAGAQSTNGARTQKRSTKQAASRSGNGARTAKKGSSRSAAKRTTKTTASASRPRAGARKKS